MCVLYNPPQLMILKARLLVVAIALASLLPSAQAVSWDQPAAALARQIASLSGPGPVQLVLNNRSALPATEVPQIRQLLEQDLRSFGIVPGSGDSTTLVRVTLSENLRGGLWIAEVKEGTETRVTMLPVKLDASSAAPGAPTLTLRQTTIITESDPVLDAQVFSSTGEQRLLVLEPQRVMVYVRTATPTTPPSPWKEEQVLTIPFLAPLSRDVRGRIAAAQDHLFDAYLPGVLCRGSNNWSAITLTCSGSDDPWPITATQKAFYDSARDYFMGVVVPGFGMQLAPFYEAADIPRVNGSATLLNNVNGSAVLVQSNITIPVNGADNWGSDFAAVHSACGSGTQLIVSGSGSAAAGDSLRAYEISGREALPVSAPLQVPGVVTAIWPASSEDNATVVIHKAASDEYEVWSVAASCN
ncbi:MAG TPA: hypothetical protein VGT04_14570 [Acidobacteriaceae bacterium]|nr:hypothetical protein [Acidobacteriaceae bacterium]